MTETTTVQIAKDSATEDDGTVEHEGTVVHERTTDLVEAEACRLMTTLVVGWAECSCGWVGPRHESADITPLPEWDLNLHFAEA